MAILKGVSKWFLLWVLVFLQLHPWWMSLLLMLCCCIFFFFSVVFWMRTICSVWDHKVFISLVDDQLLVLHPEQLLAGPDYFVIGWCVNLNVLGIVLFALGLWSDTLLERCCVMRDFELRQKQINLKPSCWSRRIAGQSFERWLMVAVDLPPQLKMCFFWGDGQFSQIQM